MGSFNVQCAVSKIDITYGDDVVIIPLFKSNRLSEDMSTTINEKALFEATPKTTQDYLIKHDPDYVNNLSTEKKVNIKRLPKEYGDDKGEWKIGFPIFAKYNDYGGFEFDKKQKNQLATKVFLNIIRKQAIPIKENETHQYCRNNFNPSDLPQNEGEAIDKITSLIFDHDLVIFDFEGVGLKKRSDGKNYIPVSFTFIDKKVYDLILNSEQSLSEKNNVEIDNILNQIIDYSQKTELYYNKDTANEDTREAYFKARQKYESLNLVKNDHSYLYYGNHLTDFENYVSRDKENKKVFITPENQAKFKSFLELKGEAFVIQNFMRKLNQSWEPIITTGQTTNGNIFKYQFNQKVNKIIQEKIIDHSEIHNPKTDNQNALLKEIKNDPDVLLFAKEETLKDKDFAKKALAISGHALRYFDDSIKNDKELVLIAVSTNGDAIGYASQQLKNDLDVAHTATQQYKYAEQYIGHQLKQELTAICPDDPISALKIIKNKDYLNDVIPKQKTSKKTNKI